MTPIVPFWFKLRQGKAEPHGEGDMLKLSGPNMREAYLSIRATPNNRWEAGLRLEPAGPDIATAEIEGSPKDAWDAAFELYRTHLIF